MSKIDKTKMNKEIKEIMLKKYPNGLQFIENNKQTFDEIYKSGQLDILNKIEDILVKYIDDDLIACFVLDYVLNTLDDLEGEFKDE